MKYFHQWSIQSFPSAVLVSPDGQSLSVAVAEPNRPFRETLTSALEDILSSPKRKEILKQVIESYATVLLIEGPDDQENKKARQAISAAIEQVSAQMEFLPKPIANPPALVVMEQKSLRQEEILLWSLGLDANSQGGRLSAEVNQPHAAVFYGRARWIGPLFKGEQIDEYNLASVLFVVGADCECGFDYRWLQGTMLPARWGQKMQARVAENLGFDPENPMVKMEMSRIVGRGYSAYPGVPFGYQEFLLETGAINDAPLNRPNQIVLGTPYAEATEKTESNLMEVTPLRGDQPNSVSYPVRKQVFHSNDLKQEFNSNGVNPSANGFSPFRNTIFILIGLCSLVLFCGIAILVRAQKR